MKNKYLVLFTFLMLFSQPVFAAYVPNNIVASSPDIVISPSGCKNAPCTIGSTQIINAQGTTASYTILSTDMGKTVTHNKSTAVAVTLPQAGTTGFETGKSYSEINIGAGTVTITPTTSTVNGNATQVLTTGQSAYFISDGTNWVAFLGVGGGGSGSGTVNSGTSGQFAYYASSTNVVSGNSTYTTSTVPLLNAVNTFTAGNAVTPATVTISTATFTPNLATSNNHNITLVHASCPCTLANPTNIVAGESGVIVVNQSATGSDFINTYGTDYVFTNNAAPTLSTTASAVDMFSYYVVDSTHIRLAPLIATVPGATTTNGIISNGTKFTTSGCSVSATAGGATAGTFTSGTTGACTVVVTMNGATGLTAPTGWSCWSADNTTGNLYRQTASSTTTATFSGTTVSGDVVDFGCMGY